MNVTSQVHKRMLTILQNERASICKFVAREGQLIAPEDKEKLEKAYAAFDNLWDAIRDTV